MSRAFACVVLVLASAASATVACGASSSSSPAEPATLPAEAGPLPAPDAEPVDSGVDAPAAHVTPPALEVIPNNGGPIIASPEVITITWQGDPIAADLEAFDDWLLPSAFWKTMMAEWGVGPGKHGGQYRIPTAAPATLDDAATRALLAAAIASGAVPPPNGSRIYTVYPPAGTVVTSFGAQGCDAFQAYHSAFASTGDAGATLAIYAIAPRCADTGGLSATDFITWGMSHEIMEASSDPDANHPTWVINAQTPATPVLGENADLCTGQEMVVEGHAVTRNYSNVAAKAGARPCVPAPAGPMFGIFADPGSVDITPGSVLVVPVHFYATGPYPAFKVGAYALDPELTATLDKSSGKDGDEATLTLRATAKYAGTEGQNVVLLASVGKDYSTRLPLVVNVK